MMEFNPEHIDLFDRYVKNLMSDSEKETFLKQMHEDPELKSQFEAFQNCLDMIQTEGLRELKSTIKSKGTFRYFGNLWGKKWTLAYAAIFVLFAIGLFWIERYEGKKNGAQDTLALNESRPEDGPSPNIEPLLKDARSKKKSKTPAEDTPTLDKDPEEQEMPITDSDDLLADELREELDPITPPDLALNDSQSDRPDSESQDANQVPDRKVAGAEPQSSPAERGRAVQEESINVKGSVVLLDTLYTVISYPDSVSYSLKVVFVQSPLNSKVYSFSIVQQLRELNIYGIQPGAQIAFKEINQSLYVFDGKNIYALIRTGGGNYLPLQRVNDPQISQLFISNHGN